MYYFKFIYYFILTNWYYYFRYNEYEHFLQKEYQNGYLFSLILLGSLQENLYKNPLLAEEYYLKYINESKNENEIPYFKLVNLYFKDYDNKYFSKSYIFNQLLSFYEMNEHYISFYLGRLLTKKIFKLYSSMSYKERKEYNKSKIFDDYNKYIEYELILYND